MNNNDKCRSNNNSNNVILHGHYRFLHFMNHYCTRAYHLGCLGTPDVSPAPKAFVCVCITLKSDFKVPV